MSESFESDRAESTTPMDHAFIERAEVVRRYVRGALPVEARDAFEDHLVDCAACQEAVESEEALGQGFKALAAEEAIARQVVAAGILAGATQRYGRWALLGALGVLLAIGPYLAWRIQGRRGAAAEAASQTRISELSAEVERLSSQRIATATPSSVPQVNTPFHYLSTVRDATTRVDRLPRPPAGMPLVLVMETDAPAGAGVRAVLAQAGQVMWEGEGLESNAFGAFVVTLPAGWALSGRHDLTLEATWPDREPAVVARYAFELVDTP